jgi:hypothetical protein
MRTWKFLSLVLLPLILAAAASLQAFEKKVVLVEAYVVRC